MGWDDALGLADPPTPAADPAPRRGHVTVHEAPPGPRRASSSSSERAAARRRRKRQQLAAAGNQRRDIQGLRALAVLVVVVNHVFDWPRGGFLGVDVFFVISGYLITGLLLREEQRTNTLSMVGFYKRRIRRLFPSALTVTVLTVIGAYLLFGSERFTSVLHDSIWATLFAANWRFVSTGTDYFGSTAAVSPLQHYWSLSVEEQYYVVWPIALLIACFVARRLAPGRAGATTAGVLTMGVLLTGASFVVATQQTSSEPVVAYFSTFTRGWELGIGSLLAVVAPKLFPLVSRVGATVLSWVGLVLIVVSFFVIGSGSVPFPAAILPCVGAAMVIAGWSTRGEAVNPALTNRAAVYLGDISYSVYVVHFPVIVLGSALVGDRSTSVVFYVTLFAVVLGLSMLLYHFIEDPIRRSTWLTSSKKRTTPSETSSVVRPAVAAGLGLALCVGATALFVVAAPTPASNQLAAAAAAAAAAPSATASSTVAAGPPTPALDAMQAELSAALKATAWPALNPPMDQPSDPTAKIETCVTAYDPGHDCTWGNPAATHTLYMVGDSTSASMIEAFATAVEGAPDWKVRAGSGDGCPWTNAIPDSLKHNWPATCTARNAGTVQDIQQTRPDLLVVTHGRMDSDFTTGITAQLDQVRSSVGKIVILVNPPTGADPGECYTAVSTPADCLFQPDSGYTETETNAAAVATKYDGVNIDATDWVCVDDYCPAFAGTLPIRKDKTHLTEQFSAALGPVVLESFKNLKLVT